MGEIDQNLSMCRKINSLSDLLLLTEYTNWDKIIYRLGQSVIRNANGSVKIKTYKNRVPVKVSQICNNFISYLFDKIKKDDWLRSHAGIGTKTIRQIYAKYGVI